MEAAHYYKDINDMLGGMGLPHIRHEEFYIVKFEDCYFDFTPENADLSPYTHDYFEVSIGEGHKATVTINDSEHDFAERNLMFISPRQVVAWKNEAAEDYYDSADTTSFLLLFKPEFLPFASDVFDVYKKFPFFNHNSKLAYSVSRELREDFFAILQDIYDRYRNEEEDYLEYARAQLILFLLKAKRSLKPAADVNIEKSRAHEITYNFENLLKHTENKRQAISYYADLLHVSPAYLSECVKKVTNKTVKAIVDEYLVLEVKSLLKKSNAPIAQIALDLGFSDDSNFTKFFRSKTGMTPRTFRKQEAA